MINSFADILARVNNAAKQKIAVIKAGDNKTLEAVKEAEAQGLAEFILIDTRESIEEAARKIDYSLDSTAQIEAKTDQEASYKAVELVRTGQADLLMKGNVHTSIYLREVLNKETGLRGDNILSHVAVFEKDEGGLFIVTDCAMTIQPTISEKIQLINNAVAVGQALGRKQVKVGILSFIENINLNSQSTIDAAILSKMSERGQIKNAIVDGPFALDNALFQEAAEQKGLSGPVAGQADVLLVPNLEVGNALFKSFSMIAKLKGAGVVMGGAVPLIQSPRADPIESKVNSIILGLHLMNVKQNRY